MSQQFNLPPTHVKPDHSYFEDQVESYDFVADGHEARLGFIKAGFDGVFPADEGGEEITLLSPLQKRGELAIDVLDDDGNVETSHRLVNEFDSVSIPGGKQMRVATTKAVVEYVCVYPGKPAEADITPHEKYAEYDEEFGDTADARPSMLRNNINRHGGGHQSRLRRLGY